MITHAHIRWLAVPALVSLVSIFSFTGCSSSSSGYSGDTNTTSSSLAGLWKIWPTPAGQIEFGPEWEYFETSGAAVSGVSLTGTINGNSFTVTLTDGGDTTEVVGSMTSPTTATGTFTHTPSAGSPETGTFRMEKFTPTGTFSVSGTISGTDITHSSTTAFAGQEYSDPGKTVLSEIEMSCADGTLKLEIDFQPANLAVGVLPVGTGPGQVDVEVSFESLAVNLRPRATGGTLTVTKYDATGFTGTFSLDLDTADTITGTFDVAFDIQSFGF